RVAAQLLSSSRRDDSEAREHRGDDDGGSGSTRCALSCGNDARSCTAAPRDDTEEISERLLPALADCKRTEVLALARAVGVRGASSLEAVVGWCERAAEHAGGPASLCCLGVCHDYGYGTGARPTCATRGGSISWGGACATAPGWPRTTRRR